MDDFNVVQAMERMGGGFVRALAFAWRMADPDNQSRLKAAFPEYWEKYSLMSVTMANRDNA